VRLEADVEDGVIVIADREDLYQVVFNLVENAIKYNVVGGSVAVSVKREAGCVVFRVADTGIGIPESDLPHIFSRFYRVDKARSREAGGSGLGLSIVRDAVILHGGEISVSPNVPQGTVFTVTLKEALHEL
jgi:signal transduction histidine kinase